MRSRAGWLAPLIVVLVASLWLVGPAGTAAQVTTSDVVWSANHENGTTADWWNPAPARVEGNNCGGEYNNFPASSEVVLAPHTGRYGLALRVPDMNTGNSLGARVFRWCEPRQHRALYYSAWYYVPQAVRVDSWWWLMEWKSLGSFNAKFGLAVANRPDGQMFVYLERGQDSGGGAWGQSAKNLPVGRWFHLEAYYAKATDGTGRVTVWQDGTQIIDLAGVQTANSADLGWAVINYGQYTAPSDVTIFVDDAAISTARVGSGGTGTTATPTAVPSATPTAVPISCSPRPPIVVTTSSGDPGRLEVQVAAAGTGQPAHTLRTLRFGDATNALIDVRGHSGTVGNIVVELPDRPRTVSFTVRRKDAALGTTVPLVVIDDCGAWPTFVGGGRSAF